MPSLPKIFRPVTQNTLIFLFGSCQIFALGSDIGQTYKLFSLQRGFLTYSMIHHRETIKLNNCDEMIHHRETIKLSNCDGMIHHRETIKLSSCDGTKKMANYPQC